MPWLFVALGLRARRTQRRHSPIPAQSAALRIAHAVNQLIHLKRRVEPQRSPVAPRNPQGGATGSARMSANARPYWFGPVKFAFLVGAALAAMVTVRPEHAPIAAKAAPTIQDFIGPDQ